MAVRLTNRTDAEIGVDLRGKQPGVKPEPVECTGHEQRLIIDERRAILTAPDQGTNCEPTSRPLG